jgi:hypothetical protein
MQGETEGLFRQPMSISCMDGYLCAAEMGYLLYVCGMIKVAVGEHDDLDLLTIGFNFVREDAGVDEDVPHHIGISKISPARDPSHRHAYY